MTVDLFSYQYPKKPGFKEPTTSKEAAQSMVGRAAKLRERCLLELSNMPGTADEVASALGETVLAVRPRITELFQLGKIVDTGRRRQNASGRKAKVWRAK